MAKNNKYLMECKDGTRTFKHRLVAEKMLGRELKNEVVHHVDGNGFNNNPENLWIFKTSSDHSRFHQTGLAERQEDGTYIGCKSSLENQCAFCGELTWNDKFCSQECFHFDARKVIRPNYGKLMEMINDTSYCAVGRKYGVSDNAIRKWVAAYEK